MKAVCFKEYGGPDKLIYGDAPDPVPGPGDVLVRVKACALNRLDVWLRMGIPGLEVPLPHIPGCDVAGVVEKTGARVMAAPGLSCGKCASCLSGGDHLCDQYGILGQQRPGGYAELVAVPEANLVPLPDHVSFEEAASFPLVFLTAWHMLVTLAKVKAGGDGVGAGGRKRGGHRRRSNRETAGGAGHRHRGVG